MPVHDDDDDDDAWFQQYLSPLVLSPNLIARCNYKIPSDYKSTKVCSSDEMLLF